MKALYAIVNGDSIYDIIVDITDKNNFYGQIYGYLFTILFIIVVMNVFIAIIQEAYVSAKVASQSQWIYSDLLKKKFPDHTKFIINYFTLNNNSMKKVILV